MALEGFFQSEAPGYKLAQHSLKMTCVMGETGSHDRRGRSRLGAPKGPCHHPRCPHSLCSGLRHLGLFGPGTHLPLLFSVFVPAGLCAFIAQLLLRSLARNLLALLAGFAQADGNGLFTLAPLPLLSVPRLRLLIARLTSFDAERDVFLAAAMTRASSREIPAYASRRSCS